MVRAYRRPSEDDAGSTHCGGSETVFLRYELQKRPQIVCDITTLPHMQFACNIIISFLSLVFRLLKVALLELVLLESPVQKLIWHGSTVVDVTPCTHKLTERSDYGIHVTLQSKHSELSIHLFQRSSMERFSPYMLHHWHEYYNNDNSTIWKKILLS